MKTKFKIIAHTADAALRVWGEDWSALLSNAAEGMYQIIFGQWTFICKKKWHYSASASNIEELLVGFLNELNFLIIMKQQAVCPSFTLSIEQKDGIFHLLCRAKSGPIPKALWQDITEIKAVTYHSLNIVRQDGLLTTSVVFDL